MTIIYRRGLKTLSHVVLVRVFQLRKTDSTYFVMLYLLKKLMFGVVFITLAAASAYLTLLQACNV